MNDTRRVVVWERDGRESSVALVADVDYAFVVNGKTDGSSVGDAGTQVMLGLVGAAAQALWHWQLIRDRTREGCFKAFRLNHWLGCTVFVGVVAGFALR